MEIYFLGNMSLFSLHCIVQEAENYFQNDHVPLLSIRMTSPKVNAISFGIYYIYHDVCSDVIQNTGENK